jgi:hypothetical protein
LRYLGDLLAADRAAKGAFYARRRKTPAKTMSDDSEISGRLAALEAQLAPPSEFDRARREVRDLVRHLLTHKQELAEFEEFCRDHAAQGGSD